MNRFLVICAAMSSFTLSACAADPQPSLSAPIKRAVTPPGGQWEVTDARAVGPTGGNVAPYLGQRLALYEKSAGHPSGRKCAQPVYMGWDAPADSVLGAPAPSGDESRPVMEVTCDGEAFGTYVGLADGRLMSRVGDWLLTLKRAPAEAMPTPIPPLQHPKPEPMKVEAPKPAEASKPAGVDKRTVVYLASYKSEASARAGWKVLARTSPILAKQQPIVNQVVLERKNNEKWYRLYGMAADEAERAAICKQLGKLVDECGSRLRE